MAQEKGLAAVRAAEALIRQLGGTAHVVDGKEVSPILTRRRRGTENVEFLIPASLLESEPKEIEGFTVLSVATDDFSGTPYLYRAICEASK